MYNYKSESELINAIVNRIDQLRVAQNYSMYKLADKSGMSINTIKYLYKKRGIPNVRTIINICNAFEIPVWVFFYKESNDIPLSGSVSTLINNYINLSDSNKDLILTLSKALK